MAMKPSLPPIAEDELSPPPRRRVDFKRMPARNPDDHAIASNSLELGSSWGASTSLSRADPEPPAPRASLRIEIPLYLDDELAQRAAKERVTKQYLVVQALHQAGYEVREQDLVGDRRKARRKG